MSGKTDDALYVGGQKMDDFPIDECPVCLEPMDYCQGHGEIGDPEGFRMLLNYYDEEKWYN